MLVDIQAVPVSKSGEELPREKAVLQRLDPLPDHLEPQADSQHNRLHHNSGIIRNAYFYFFDNSTSPNCAHSCNLATLHHDFLDKEKAPP